MNAPIMSLPQARVVAAVADRYNAGRRMRFLDSWKLYRAFSAVEAKERARLARLFANKVKPRSKRAVHKFIEQAKETGLSEPKTQGIIGAWLRDLCDGRKFHGLPLATCLTGASCECPDAKSNVLAQLEKLGALKVELMACRLGFKVLASTVYKFYKTACMLAIAPGYFLIKPYTELIDMCTKPADKITLTIGGLSLAIFALFESTHFFRKKFFELFRWHRKYQTFCITCPHVNVNWKPREKENEHEQG